jgi:hypothetical protein
VSWQRESTLIFRDIPDLLLRVEAFRGPIGRILQNGSLTTNAEKSGETAHAMGKYFLFHFSALDLAGGDRL